MHPLCAPLFYAHLFAHPKDEDVDTANDVVVVNVVEDEERERESKVKF